MQIEILTEQEILTFNSELIEEIKKTIKSDNLTTTKWFGSSAIRKLLEISPGTLQDLGIKGVLPHEKIVGICHGQTSPFIK